MPILIVLLLLVNVFLAAPLCAQNVQVTNDCPSIQIISQTPGTDAFGNRKLKLEMKNAGDSPLLAVIYFTNKDLLIAQHGYGPSGHAGATKIMQGKYPSRVNPGKTFEAELEQPFPETVQFTIGTAVFRNGKDEGDLEEAESIRAEFAGQTARARQLLPLLKTPPAGKITKQELIDLEAKVKALTDLQPPKKLSQKARDMFRNAQKDQSDDVLHLIYELKDTGGDREFWYPQFRQSAERILEVLK